MRRARRAGGRGAALTGDLRTAARGVELDSALRGTMVLAQRGDTLGARIAAAHADTARVAPGLPTLLVGMDTPQADAELIRSCLSSLTTEDGPDAVLGTATDGGWWALGRLGDARRSQSPRLRRSPGPRSTPPWSVVGDATDFLVVLAGLHSDKFGPTGQLPATPLYPASSPRSVVATRRDTPGRAYYQSPGRWLPVATRRSWRDRA